MLLKEFSHLIDHLPPLLGAVGLHAAMELFIEIERHPDELLGALRSLSSTDESISGGEVGLRWRLSYGYADGLRHALLQNVRFLW